MLANSYPATTPRQRRPAYPFPELDVASIRQCLENLSVNLTDSDLRKPTSNQVIRLFEILGDKLMGLKVNNSGIASAGMGYLGVFEEREVREKMLEDIADYPELHENSLPNIAFFHHWARLMMDIGVPEFTLVDWMKPDTKRLIVILSGIINFARFRDVHLATFDEVTQRSDQYIVMKEELMHKNQQLLAKIEAIKRQRAEEEPVVEKLKLEVSAMNSQLKQKKAKGDSINADVARLKQSRTDLQEKLQNVTLLLQHAKQECNRLRTRVVHNPEQIKKAIADMNQSVQSLKQDLHQSESKARDMLTKQENLNLVEQDLLHCLKVMQECEEEQRAMDLARQQVHEQSDGVARKENELKELGIKESQLKRQEIAQHEKLTRARQLQQTKLADLTSKWQKARTDWDQFSQDRAVSHSQIQKVEQTQQEWRQKIQQAKQRHEVDLQAIQSSFAKLKECVGDYVAEMERLMSAQDDMAEE